MSEITNRQQLIHLHSSVIKELSPESINFGEIAVQYAAEEPLLYIKDSDGNIVKFLDSNKINEYIEDIYSAITMDEYTIAFALNDLNRRIEYCATSDDLNEIIEQIGGGGALDERYVQISDFNEFSDWVSNQLNSISNTIPSQIEQLSAATSDAINQLSTVYATSAATHEAINDLRKEVIDDELVVAAALNDLNERLSGYTTSADIDALLENYALSSATNTLYEDLDTRIGLLDDKFEDYPTSAETAAAIHQAILDAGTY